MMKRFSDHLGNTLSIPFPPSRIISLVPSQTELLADLGLDYEVVGITRFCIHPADWLQTKKIVGGTKSFDFNTIEALKPDLILANKEENYREGIEKLQQHFPVWISDVVSWEQSLSLIKDTGELTNREKEASEIIAAIQQSFASLVPLQQDLSVLYLIWRKPWMGAASGTFIDTMLSRCGLRNSLQSLSRYPELTPEQMTALNPDVVFLSSEPFPFREKHVAEIQAICPSAHIMLVDGEMFSWHGSRQMKAALYIKNILAELARYRKTK